MEARLSQITSSAGESAHFLARTGYSTVQVREALIKRFGLSGDLAHTIATEAVNRCTMVNTDEPQDSGGPHGTT